MSHGDHSLNSSFGYTSLARMYLHNNKEVSNIGTKLPPLYASRHASLPLAGFSLLRVYGPRRTAIMLHEIEMVVESCFVPVSDMFGFWLGFGSFLV